LKKRALRRQRTLLGAGDSESLGLGAIRKNPLALLMKKLRAPFTRLFWEDLFESNEEEILVDSKLLSYSYLEIGMIQAIGA
jgi:sodium/potassium-transporting ATPase subunit alpha